jgi:hypothetical protein
MATRKPADFPTPLRGGEEDPQHDERIGEVRQDVERDEGGPTHDRSGGQVPRRDSGEPDRDGRTARSDD